MKRINAWVVILFLTLLSAQGQTAEAYEFAGVDIHGFLSQGYLNSTEYDFLGFPSKGGSFAVCEAGVNFSAQLSEKLRLGLQLFAQDFGSWGNHDVVLDWAVGDYRWKDWLGLRFGKVKLPLGLYNQGLDADMLRTFIFLSQAVYDYRLRDMWHAYLGGEVYGVVKGPWNSDFDYELFGGTLDLANSPFIRNSILTTMLPNMPPGTQIILDDLEIEYKYIVGCAFRWNTPLESLRVGISFHTGSEEMEATLITSVPVIQALPILQLTSQNRILSRTDNKYNIVLSAEFSRGNLTVATEYTRQRNDIRPTVAIPLPGMPPELYFKAVYEGMYGQVCYRFLDRFEVGAYYSVFFSNGNDRDGDALAAKGQPRHSGWQKDLCLSTRIDITPHWLVKFEAHLMDGAALSEKTVNPSDAKRYWGLFGVKTSVNF